MVVSSGRLPGDATDELVPRETGRRRIREQAELVARGADHEVDAGGASGAEGVDRRTVHDVAVVDRVERHHVGREHRRDEGGALRVEDRVDRQLAETVEVGPVEAQVVEERPGHQLGLLGGRDLGLAALDHRPPERVAAPGRREQLEDRSRARGLAEHGDPVGVAAERGRVRAHPRQCGELVAQTAVRGRVAGRPDRAEGHEAQRAEPVVDRDDHGVALGREARRVVDGLRRAAGHERAAGDPHEDRAGRRRIRPAPRR